MSLPAPGSPGFSALLFRHVLDHPALKDWAVNPSLFSTILLTLIAKNGGLIIDIDDYKSDKIVGVVRTVCSTPTDKIGLRLIRAHIISSLR